MAKKKAAKKPKATELVYIAESLRCLALPIDSIKDDPRNANKHSEKNLNAIRASLSQFGQLKPIVVNGVTSRIVAGHGTVEAAKSLNWSHVAANVVSMTDAEARDYGIADNRTAELADWDKVMLLELTLEVQQENELLFDELLLGDLVDVPGGDAVEPKEVNIEGRLMVQCYVDSEEQQEEVWKLIKNAGYEPKVVTV